MSGEIYLTHNVAPFIDPQWVCGKGRRCFLCSNVMAASRTSCTHCPQIPGYSQPLVVILLRSGRLYFPKCNAYIGVDVGTQAGNARQTFLVSLLRARFDRNVIAQAEGSTAGYRPQFDPQGPALSVRPSGVLSKTTSSQYEAELLNPSVDLSNLAPKHRQELEDVAWPAWLKAPAQSFQSILRIRPCVRHFQMGLGHFEPRCYDVFHER